MSEDSVFFVCITILFILCAGEPDLLDGFRELLLREK